MNSKVAVTCITALVSAPALSADLSNFPPTDTPYGWIAPVAVSQLDVSDGNAKLYRGWFDNVTFAGDLVEHNISTSGAVSSSTNWSAKALLDGRTFSDRTVIKGSAPTDNLCDNTGAALDLFLCGDNSGETTAGGTYRDRASDLGTIIHSNPVHVGKPRYAYNFDNYLSFRADNLSRTERLYVGANDGMLHAFDSSGNEIFGYIPSMVESKLASLANGSGSQYMVDGPLISGDAYADFDGSGSHEWASLLVGGLGAGGKGYFALDVTTPVASSAGASAVADTILWEFSPAAPAAPNDAYKMGYTYGSPVIARTNDNGKWALIAPNGYDQGSKPVLYIRDIHAPDSSPSNVIKDFHLPSSLNNGLSSLSTIDVDGDFKVDYAYAGDLNGNLWRFDISADKNISTEWTATKIFTATDGTYGQPILAAPELARLEDGTVMVFFGTGDPWSIASATSHSFYALIDNLDGVTTYNRSNLQPRLLGATTNAAYQTLDKSSASNYNSGEEAWVRVSSAQKGWYLDLSAGEHLLQPPVLDDSRVQFIAHDPTNGANWLTQLDYRQGLLPAEVVFDTDGNGLLDSSDDIDGARVVSVKKSADLISGQALATVNNGRVLSYLNAWSQGVEGEEATEETTETVTDYTYSAACSRLNLNRIRLTEDDYNNPYSVKATLSNGDIVEASIGVNPDTESSYEATPPLGEYPAGAGAGSATVDGTTQKWFGMYITATRQGSDDFSLKIHWHSPYKISSLTVTSGKSIQEIKEGASTCEYDGADYVTKQCSGSSSGCQSGNMSVSGSTITGGSDWNGLNAYSGSDNVTTVTKTVTVPGTDGTDPVAAVGKGEEQLQDGYDGHTGRLRWRELIFGE